MSNRKRGLGQGLDVLLSSVRSDSVDSGSGTYTELPVEQLQRGRYQPRTQLGESELEMLAESIREQGVLQPVVVRAVGDDRYEIVAGERRWRAAQLAGLQQVPALIKDIDNRSALAVGLVENIQRKALNPIEEALALGRLTDEFGLTHQQAAGAVGRSRAAVTNILRLLKLHPEVRAAVEKGELELGHARALLALEGADQVAAAQQVVQNELSVRETEALISRMKRPRNPKSPVRDSNIEGLEQKLGDTLGARIRIMHQNTGKGRLVIHYNSLDELDGILGHIH